MKTISFLLLLCVACVNTQQNQAVDPNAPFQIPSPYQVFQSKTGDCALLASLASVALVKPYVISNAISGGNDGNYVVKLFDYEHAYKSIYIPVNISELPFSYTAYSTEENDSANWWVPLIEVAYSKHFGYAQLNSGSDPKFTMELITGESATTITNLNSVITLEQFKKLLQLVNNNSPVVISTYDTFVLDNNLVPNHSYTVIYAIDNIVSIRNPWGRSYTSNDFSGIENITIEEAYALFRDITILSKELSYE